MPVDILASGSGRIGRATIRLTSFHGLTGLVHLSVAGLETGLYASFDLTPLVLPAGGSIETGLTFVHDGRLPPGSYHFVVVATTADGAVQHQVEGTIELVFEPAAIFALSITPHQADCGVTNGATAAFTVTASSVNAFAGTIALTAEGLGAGLSAAFVPAAIELPADGAAAAVLTITNDGTAAQGVDAFTVRGRNASAPDATVDASLSVQPVSDVRPRFTLTIDPTHRVVSADQPDETTYAVAVHSVNGYTGSVHLDVLGLAQGLAAALSPAAVFVGPGGTENSVLTILHDGSLGPNDYPFTVRGRDEAAPFGPLAAVVAADVELAPAADYRLTIVPHYRAGPFAAATYDYDVLVDVLGLFSGTMVLSASMPPGCTATFSQDSIDLQPDQSYAVALTITVTTPVSGLWPFLVQGTVASPLRYRGDVAQLEIASPAGDFGISTTPRLLKAAIGTSGLTQTAVVEAVAANGFEGLVDLSLDPFPMFAGFTPKWEDTTSYSSSVTLPKDGTAHRSLSFRRDGAALGGIYTATITGISAGQSRATSVVLCVTDFRLAYQPAPPDLPEGAVGSSATTIAVEGRYGHEGPVTLSVSGAPPGMTAMLSAGRVTLGGDVDDAKNTGSVALSLSTNGLVPQGAYTVVVTGVSAGVTRTLVVPINVTQPCATPLLWHVYGRNIPLGPLPSSYAVIGPPGTGITVTRIDPDRRIAQHDGYLRCAGAVFALVQAVKLSPPFFLRFGGHLRSPNFGTSVQVGVGLGCDALGNGIYLGLIRGGGANENGGPRWQFYTQCFLHGAPVSNRVEDVTYTQLNGVSQPFDLVDPVVPIRVNVRHGGPTGPSGLQWEFVIPAGVRTPTGLLSRDIVFGGSEARNPVILQSGPLVGWTAGLGPDIGGGCLPIGAYQLSGHVLDETAAVHLCDTFARPESDHLGGYWDTPAGRYMLSTSGTPVPAQGFFLRKGAAVPSRFRNDFDSGYAKGGVALYGRDQAARTGYFVEIDFTWGSTPKFLRSVAIVIGAGDTPLTSYVADWDVAPMTGFGFGLLGDADGSQLYAEPAPGTLAGAFETLPDGSPLLGGQPDASAGGGLAGSGGWSLPYGPFGPPVPAFTSGTLRLEVTGSVQQTVTAIVYGDHGTEIARGRMYLPLDYPGRRVGIAATEHYGAMNDPIWPNIRITRFESGPL